MSRFERPYAEQLFPLVVREARYLASVAWRVLMRYAEERDAFEFFTAEQAALVPETLEHWRAFVLGEVETPGIHDLHYVPMGVLGHATGNLKLPPNFNRYLLLSTEMHVASNSAQAFVYVKMGPSLAFGLIHPPPADQWIGTRVAIGDGHVGGRMGLSARVLEYLFERAENVHMLNERRSVRQEQKIVQAMRANPERFAASKTHRAFAADIGQFGIERVFPPDEDADGRRPT